MINEASARREDFEVNHSVPIVLADGQAWYIPKPWLVLKPVIRDGVAVSCWKWLTYGPDLERLVAAIADTDDSVDQILSTMSLGAFLIRRNYNLMDAELESLFQYRVGDPASEAMVTDIIRTATGNGGKKALPGGGS